MTSRRTFVKSSISILLMGFVSGCLDNPKPAEAGRLWWRRDLGEPMMFTPEIYGGRLYGGKVNGEVTALNIETGSQVWKFAPPSTPGFFSSPVVSNDVVYVVNKNGMLYGLDIHDGEVVWEFETDNRVFTSPTISRGQLYTASDEFLYCIDVTKSDLIWKWGVPGAGPGNLAAPTPGSSYVYFGGEDLHAIDISTGKEAWRYDEAESVPSTPEFEETTNRVYVGTSDGAIALNAETGEEVWLVSNQDNKPDDYSSSEVFGSPTVAGENVYIPNKDGTVFSINKRDGTVNWRYPTTDGYEVGAPTIHDEKAYLASKKLHVVNTSNGEELWTYEPEQRVIGSVRIHEDIAYFSSRDGYVHAVRI